MRIGYACRHICMHRMYICAFMHHIHTHRHRQHTLVDIHTHTERERARERERERERTLVDELDEAELARLSRRCLNDSGTLDFTKLLS